jgi:hypothetical protein
MLTAAWLEEAYEPFTGVAAFSLSRAFSTHGISLAEW